MSQHKYSLILSVICVLVTIGMISGCASLSEQECLTANWQAIGFEDGQRGNDQSRISRHRKACAEYGVRLDFESYQQGYKQGIREYCVPERGYELGVQGTAYSGVCPRSLEPDFIKANSVGLEIHQLTQQIDRFNAQIDTLQSDQLRWQQTISDNETVIVADGTSPQLRRELLEQNKALDRLINDASQAISRSEIRRAAVIRRLALARQRGWR